MKERLEPVMHVVALVPAENAGAVAACLEQRRGRILSREPSGDNQIIRARVPQAGMMNFWPEMTSRTGGRGTFSMVAYEFQPALDAPPTEPEVGVREPRHSRPGGQHGAISVKEPDPESYGDRDADGFTRA